MSALNLQLGIHALFECVSNFLAGQLTVGVFFEQPLKRCYIGLTERHSQGSCNGRGYDSACNAAYSWEKLQ